MFFYSNVIMTLEYVHVSSCSILIFYSSYYSPVQSSQLLTRHAERSQGPRCHQKTPQSDMINVCRCGDRKLSIAFQIVVSSPKDLGEEYLGGRILRGHCRRQRDTKTHVLPYIRNILPVSNIILVLIFDFI